MDTITVIIFILCVVWVFPVLVGLVELRSSKLTAIIEVEEDKITIRQFAVERLFCLKGNTVHSSNIVRIQFATNPNRGTCVTLFNKSNGALDFWVPEHLVKGVSGQLKSVCPQAKFVYV
ncbi:hypothetical protein LCL85_07905 [Vibrio alginolyticus]|nr:hypothetical protein [Vibrio alginolyticus]